MNDIFDMPQGAAEIDLDANFASLGDDVNLLAKDPTLKRIVVGAGWDDNAFNSDALDADLSLFLVDRNAMTRSDEDFVFYNQKETADGGIRHHGDSRTGAGEGDDESISINLQAVSFDVLQILIVVSIYKGFEKEQDLSSLRNLYVRIVNEENGEEIVRYKMDDDLVGKNDTAVIAAAINREGPKWHFKPLAQIEDGGLAGMATKRGCIINQQ